MNELPKINDLRDTYWDVLKFVLICLVVYGHVLRFSNGGIQGALYNYIYIFHMPLFIFCSGRYSHVNDKKRYLYRQMRILETYILFSIFILPAFIEATVAWKTESPYKPSFAMWYLLSLFYWRMIVYCFHAKLLDKHPCPVLLTSIIISLLGGFLPIEGTFSIQRTLTFIPFFFAGYYSKQIDVRYFVRKINPMLAIAILTLIFIITFVFFNYDLSFVLYGVRSYYQEGYEPSLLLLGRIIQMLLAIVMSICVIRLLHGNVLLSKLGQNTMIIYIYHTFPVLLFIYCMNKGYLPEKAVFTITYTILTVIVLSLLSRVKLFHILLNPISNYILKQRNLI